MIVRRAKLHRRNEKQPLRFNCRLSGALKGRESLNGVQRRQFLIAAGGLVAAPFAAEAQQAPKVARIGFLSPNMVVSLHQREAFRQGLRDLGYVEGRNVVIEYRDAEGKV